MAGSQLRLMIWRNQSGSPSAKGNAERHGTDVSKETDPTPNWKSQYRSSSLKQSVGVVSKGAGPATSSATHPRGSACRGEPGHRGERATRQSARPMSSGRAFQMPEPGSPTKDGSRRYRSWLRFRSSNYRPYRSSIFRSPPRHGRSGAGCPVPEAWAPAKLVVSFPLATDSSQILPAARRTIWPGCVQTL